MCSQHPVSEAVEIIGGKAIFIIFTVIALVNGYQKQVHTHVFCSISRCGWASSCILFSTPQEDRRIMVCMRVVCRCFSSCTCPSSFQRASFPTASTMHLIGRTSSRGAPTECDWYLLDWWIASWRANSLKLVTWCNSGSNGVRKPPHHLVSYTALFAWSSWQG